MCMQTNTLAVVFPGQSSQHLGMLSDLANDYKLVEKTFFEASEVLGYDLWKLIQCGSMDKLNKTCYSQPAVLTASVAIWRIWVEQGGKIPNIMAGHSLGEYSALVCAGGIDLSSAIKLVIVRSKLMQKVAPYGYGAMSVIIGLDIDTVIKLCKSVEFEYNQIVEPAGFNADQNIVIAGHTKAVNQVNFLCKNAGAKHVAILPISVPAHCSIMKLMAKEFQKELEKTIIHSPQIPIINNTNVCVETQPKSIRELLIRQLYTPVRWHEIMNKFSEKNVNCFIEMGPGQVLTKLIRRSIHNAYSMSINNSRTLLQVLEYIHN